MHGLAVTHKRSLFLLYVVPDVSGTLLSVPKRIKLSVEYYCTGTTVRLSTITDTSSRVLYY